jgi:hypothetical protein
MPRMDSNHDKAIQSRLFLSLVPLYKASKPTDLIKILSSMVLRQ